MWARPAAGASEAMKTSRKKVLVADCHEEVLIALEKMLEDAGFDTTTVWTARDALKLVDSAGLRSRAGKRIPAGCGMRVFAEGIA